jgi:hypothetical protein
MSLIPELIAAAAPPARGAPLGDILWASAVASALSAVVLWVASAHRAGRISWLATAARRAARTTGLPGWAALPTMITGTSQVVAVFGFYWDVSKHIDTGRDSGPFGTVAHYPILAGLAGIALGGFLAIVLGAEQRDASAVRLARGWHAPLGGLLIFLCGSFALIGFPLDDVWHTLFGQDVTLWGPTHVLMVGGASLSTLGVWVLLVEGARARRASATHAELQSLLVRWQEVAISGAFLVGLSTLQGEFDFGVPQFQLVYQPILIALATGAGLVAARVRVGRGGALLACAFYLALYGLLSVIISQLLGGSTLHFPLYLPEAIIVELVWWALPRARAVTLGAICGVLIGTVGLAAEWGWTHVWMPLPWTASMLPDTAILGLLAAIAAGVLGGFIGQALNRDATRPSSPAWLAGLAGAAALACIAYPLPMDLGSPISVTATLHTVGGTDTAGGGAGTGTGAVSGPAGHSAVAAGNAARRMVTGSFRLSPATAARDAQWVTVTAWQGGGLIVDRLRRTAPGVYVTTRPIPVYGKWKTMLRIANGRALDAAPIYLPADPAIPAKAVPAAAGFTRAFERDKKVLQREAVGGKLWLAIPAYLLLAAIAAAWMAGLAWGLRRLSNSAEADPLGNQQRAPQTARGAITRPA